MTIFHVASYFSYSIDRKQTGQQHGPKTSNFNDRTNIQRIASETSPDSAWVTLRKLFFNFIYSDKKRVVSFIESIQKPDQNVKKNVKILFRPRGYLFILLVYRLYVNACHSYLILSGILFIIIYSENYSHWIYLRQLARNSPNLDNDDSQDETLKSLSTLSMEPNLQDSKREFQKKDDSHSGSQNPESKCIPLTTLY